jgi:hypothetical protein
LLAKGPPCVIWFLPQPTKFAQRFPKTADRKFLESKLWWWRFATEEHCGLLFQAKLAFRSSQFPSEREERDAFARARLQSFKEMLIDSAHFYEFRARYNGRYAWPLAKPWPDVSPEQQFRLASLVPGEYPAKDFGSSGREADHWVSLPTRFVNLKLNNWTLMEQFMQEINALRELHGVAAPERGKGVRKRALSWTAIEAMDLRRYSICEPTDGERSALSKAQCRYEATCAQLGLEP